MTTSSTPIYLLSGICVAIGLHCFVSPKAEYSRFGLPLEHPPATSGNKTPRSLSASSVTSTVSPLMYLKGSREVCFGLNFAALQYQGLHTGVTTSLAIFSLAALVDGFVIWSCEDNPSRWKAFGHWSFFAGFAGWAAWRYSSM